MGCVVVIRYAIFRRGPPKVVLQHAQVYFGSKMLGGPSLDGALLRSGHKDEREAYPKET